jgi:hypothetical protein
MKRMYQGLMIVATAALMACSSMEVNDAEAVAENYPSDFNAGVYLELHPILLTMQILNYVKTENATYKASVDTGTYAAKVKEDSVAFVEDTASVHRIYTSPRYLDFPQEKWDSLWIEKIQSTTKQIKVEKITQITLDSLDSAGTAYGHQLVYVDSVDVDSAGSIKVIYGKLDTAETEAKEIVVDRVTVKVNSNLTKVDSVGIKDTTIVDTIPPGLDKTALSFVLSYNLHGEKKDLERLNTLVPDTEAAALQFISFGREHGWAYRRCEESEKSHKAVDPVYNPVTYPATKLYCDDNGVAREI